MILSYDYEVNHIGYLGMYASLEIGMLTPIKTRRTRAMYNAYCNDCGKQWSDNRSGRQSARQHARRTGHTTSVEVTTIWTFEHMSREEQER